MKKALNSIQISVSLQYIIKEISLWIFLFLVKCYLRKGHALVAMKDLGQAMAAFGKAIEIDPNCQVKFD